MIPSLALGVTFIVLLISGTPVSIAMGLAAIVGFIVGEYSLYLLPQALINGANNSVLIAVFFFILAGNIMNEAGVTNRLFLTARAFVGRIKGGLAYVNIIASMFFAGISGTATADIASLGKVEMKAMQEAGYDKKLSIGITIASAVVGPIIPPSVAFILYSVMAEVSVARLFLAGIVPGIVIGLCLMVSTYFLIRTGKYAAPADPPKPFKEKTRDIVYGLPGLATPLVIIIGMTTGILTPTEAGLCAIVYTFFLGLFYRELDLIKLKEVLKVSVMTSAHSILLVSIASSMSLLFTFERTPMELASFLLGITTNKFIILSLIALVLLFIGCFMSATAALLMLTPVFLPLVKAVGVDPIHFGVIIGYGLTIGVATPPVGTGLYIGSDIANMPLADVFKAILPFLIPLFIALILIVYVPQFSLFLPNYIMK